MLQRFTEPGGLRAIVALCVLLSLSGCAALPKPKLFGGDNNTNPAADKSAAHSTNADAGQQDPALSATPTAASPSALQPEVDVAVPQLQPHTQAIYERALAFAAEGQYTEADALFLELSEEQPELAGPWVNLGLSAKRREDHHQAESYFRAALKANPYNCDALSELALIARRLGQFAQAQADYLKCLKARPGFARAHLNLGILYELYLGNLSGALAAYHDYQSLIDQPDVRVSGWIADIERRVARIARR